MNDHIDTKQGDVVVTSTEPTDLMFNVWIVSHEGQQKPSPGTTLCVAMGVAAAKALAEELARRTHGSVVVHQNLEGGQVPPDRWVNPENTRKSKKLIAKISTGRLTPEARQKPESAIENNLRTASEQAASGEARLKKVEEQVQALSDAVVAIAEPSDTVDAVVKTVKDKM